MSRLLPQRRWTQLVLTAAVMLWASPNLLVAQVDVDSRPRTSVTIDERILAAFVDEPCRHFEAAKQAFITGQQTPAANHLRIAAAHLQLESARAHPDAKAELEASIAELGRMAAALERSEVTSLDALGKVFSRAHFALAGHHCVKSSYSCCQASSQPHPKLNEQAGLDLKAAANHMQQGLAWSGIESDEQLSRLVRAAHISANDLMQDGRATHGKAKHAIRSIRNKLEGFTGLKISLAPPLSERDDSGPSLFR